MLECISTFVGCTRQKSFFLKQQYFNAIDTLEYWACSPQKVVLDRYFNCQEKFYPRITESQNFRGWKGPLWVISSNHPAEARSPTAGCIGPCPGGLEYLQRTRLHNLPGQPVPGLSHPQSKQVLPHVQTELLCFSLCPLPLVLSLGTTEKSLAPSS